MLFANHLYRTEIIDVRYTYLRVNFSFVLRSCVDSQELQNQYVIINMNIFLTTCRRMAK